MEMGLAAPVTRGYFFSLGASCLVDATSPRTISIDKKKKYPLELYRYVCNIDIGYWWRIWPLFLFSSRCYRGRTIQLLCWRVKFKLLYYFFPVSFLCARLNYDRSFLHAVHVFYFIFCLGRLTLTTIVFDCPSIQRFSYWSAVVSEKCVVTTTFLFRFQ